MADPRVLLAFCSDIGITEETVKQAETIHGFRLSTDLRAKNLRQLSEERLLALAEPFGSALSLEVGIPDAAPLIEIEAGDVSTDDMQSGLTTIHERSADLELRVTIALEKEEILSRLELSGTQYSSYLYLFMSNLIDFMDSPLPVLDGNIFGVDDRPTIILICDDDIYFRGSLLTITGLNSRQQAIDALPSAKGKQLARIQRYRTQALEDLNWIGFQFDRLTPIHFIGERVSGAPNELDNIIARHLLNLCILFTANRSTLQDGTFTSTYASPDSTAELEFATDIDLPDNISLLVRLALWPYSGQRQDRLVIFQTVVARFLAGDDPKENTRLFTEQLPRILNDVRWHYRVYVDGQIDEHFQQVQAVTDYVSEMTGEVSKSLDSLTKGFVDMSLATIGVIVLTLLASLLEGEADNVIFRVGMWVYAAYLLAFQGLYRLGSIWHSYQLLNRQTETWLIAAGQRLGQSRINEISGPLKDRQKQFTFWFRTTIVLYLVVAGLIVWLSFYLPALLAQVGAGTITPTP
jgi:hypothetical protein